MSDLPGLVTGRIIITHTLTDNDVLVSIDREGDAEAAVTALGMLAMCQDTILHGEDDA